MPNQDSQISRDQILRIVRSLAGHVDLETAIQSVSSELQSIVPHDLFDAALFTEEKDRTIVFETGLKTSWGAENGLNKHSPIRDILSGEVDYLITPNAMEDHRMSGPGVNAEPIRIFKLKSRVHAKIEIGGELIGALSLSSRKEALYSDQHVAAARMIADIVGPYLHALRQAEVAKETEVMRVRDEANALGFKRGARGLTIQLERERERIGMDLHDQTLAELTRMIRTIDDPKTSDGAKIDGLRRSLVHSATELRNIIDNAKPSLLRLFGVVEAVDGFMSTSLSDFQIDWEINTDKLSGNGLDNFTDIVSLNTFRIVQEAVNNVVRHSSATKVRVKFETAERGYIVSIEDNGIGISGAVNFQKGGMANMKTRATLIGSTIDVSASNTLKGTKVQLRLPAAEALMEAAE